MPSQRTSPEASHEATSKPEPHVIAGLGSLYEMYVRQRCGSTWAPRYFVPGPTARTQLLWLRLEAVASWCTAHGVPPADFVVAQFDMWRAPKGCGPYPTPRYISDSEACVARYQRWAARANTAPTVLSPAATESARFTVDSVLRNRPGMTEADFWADPFCVAMVPPEAARGNDNFHTAVDSGVHSSLLAQAMLAEHLR